MKWGQGRLQPHLLAILGTAVAMLIHSLLQQFFPSPDIPERVADLGGGFYRKTQRIKIEEAKRREPASPYRDPKKLPKKSRSLNVKKAPTFDSMFSLFGGKGIKTRARVTKIPPKRSARVRLPRVAQRPVIQTKKFSTRDGYCSSAEYPGDGPYRTTIDRSRLLKMIEQFRQAKSDLSQWVLGFEGTIDPKLLGKLQERIYDIALEAPPHNQEPDLSWRGIGVLIRDLDGSLRIRLGGGYFDLMERNPRRGRFEFMRLVAQSWAPCELKNAKIKSPWKPLLKCLGVRDANACQPVTISESGWAVSTAVARLVAAPGCKIPAFRSSRRASCLSHPFGGGRSWLGTNDSEEESSGDILADFSLGGAIR